MKFRVLSVVTLLLLAGCTTGAKPEPVVETVTVTAQPTEQPTEQPLTPDASPTPEPTETPTQAPAPKPKRHATFNDAKRMVVPSHCTLAGQRLVDGSLEKDGYATVFEHFGSAPVDANKDGIRELLVVGTCDDGVSEASDFVAVIDSEGRIVAESATIHMISGKPEMVKAKALMAGSMDAHLIVEPYDPDIVLVPWVVYLTMKKGQLDLVSWAVETPSLQGTHITTKGLVRGRGKNTQVVIPVGAKGRALFDEGFAVPGVTGELECLHRYEPVPEVQALGIDFWAYGDGTVGVIKVDRPGLKNAEGAHVGQSVKALDAIYKGDKDWRVVDGGKGRYFENRSGPHPRTFTATIENGKVSEFAVWNMPYSQIPKFLQSDGC